MTTPQEVLLSALNNLGKDDFETFKWFLCQEGSLEGFKSIDSAPLEDANRSKTVSLILGTYETDALKVAVVVFKKIRRNDLVKKILGSIKEPTNPKRDTDESVQPEDWLQPVWTQLIDGLTEANVNQILDRLYQQKVFNAQEKSIIRAQTAGDKARKLIEGVQQKGPEAELCLKNALREVDQFLFKKLNLT